MSDDNRGLERTLMGTDDAMVWAEEFCRIFDGKTITADEGDEGVGPGSMVAWFANAMQVAIDMYERRKLRTKEPNQATEHVPDTAREAFVTGVEDGREISEA